MPAAALYIKFGSLDLTLQCICISPLSAGIEGRLPVCVSRQRRANGILLTVFVHSVPQLLNVHVRPGIFF